ncbi:MAG: hypothetical protein LBB08_00290 [Rickettsiales bacterium]|jgi:aspartate kinase|nr:hypothetical protein [Rickettsiales bacterium]
MRIRVSKFGGGVFRDISSAHAIRKAVKSELELAGKLIIVVSAMGKTTDSLLAMAPKNADPRELDRLLMTGEAIAAPALALDLVSHGIKAKSFSGMEAGISTDGRFGDAEIVRTDPSAVMEALKSFDVAVVAGFQGLGVNGELTTLGRNGSDTSAIYLASASAAQSCTFWKDVDGIYQSDPKKNAGAGLYKFLNTAELFDGAAGGILHPRALDLIKKESAAGRSMEIVIRSINIARRFTTIGRMPTELWEK